MSKSDKWDYFTEGVSAGIVIGLVLGAFIGWAL